MKKLLIPIISLSSFLTPAVVSVITAPTVVTVVAVSVASSVTQEVEAQTTTVYTTIGGLNAFVTYPSNYAANAPKRYPLILFMPGNGEVAGLAYTAPYTSQMNADTSRLKQYGPHRYIRGGGGTTPTWNGEVFHPTTGVKMECIIMSLQPSQAWYPQANFESRWNTIITAYRVDTFNIHVQGISGGGWTLQNFVSHNLRNAQQVASLYMTHAVQPTNGNSQMRYVGQSGGYYWAVRGAVSDDRQQQQIRDTINKYAPSHAFVTNITSGSGSSHCCWELFYPYTYTGSPFGTTVNPYQFALTHPRAGAYAYWGAVANNPPIPNAGSDFTVTLPTASATLNGSATDPEGNTITHTWSKVSGPTGGTIATPLNYNTTVNSLQAGTYVFRLTVSDGINPDVTDDVSVTVVSPPTITANAGADQNIFMPDNTVSLNALGSTGSGTLSYTWSKLSGPSEGNFSSTTGGQITVSNLAVGTYVFHVSVTNGSTTSGDNVTINAYQQKSPPCATGAPVTYTLPRVGNQYFYPNLSTTYPNLKGGDTIVLTGNVADNTVIRLGNFSGDSCRPIIIINKGGQVKCTGQFSINNGRFFKLTGTGDPAYTYGFYNHDNAGSSYLVTEQSSDYIVEYVHSENAINGFFSKYQVDTTDALSYTPNWEYKNAEYRFNKVDSSKGEAFYIGHTLTPTPCGLKNLMPIRYKNLKIHDNLVKYAGWDGIQISLAGDSALIYNNTINDYGWRNRPSQKSGIVFGGYSTGRIWNNTINRGTGSGISVFGYSGPIKVYDNSLDSCGIWAGNPITNPADIDYTADQNAGSQIYAPDVSIYAQSNESACLPAYPLPNLVMSITDNCISHISAVNTGAAIHVAEAGGGEVDPGVISRNTIQDPLGRALSAIIISDVGDAISANTLGTCGAPAPNAAPTADAGVNKTITLPTSSVAVVGTGTDPDGTISAYLWTKVSGPSTFSITNAASGSTSFTNLVQGIYTFRLRVTDDGGLFDEDDMTVTANAAPNTAPTANAGANQTITLPTSSVTLSGSASSDAEGPIASYKWRQISGPAVQSQTNILRYDAFESDAAYTTGTKPWAMLNAVRPAGVQTSTEKARKGLRSSRHELFNNSTDGEYMRMEIQQSSIGELGVDPDTYWYSFSSYLDPTTYNVTDPVPEILAQWHDLPDFSEGEDWKSPPVALRINNGRYVLLVWWDADRVSTNATRDGDIEYDLGPVLTGQWVDFVLRVKWSYTGTGSLQLWKNGIQLVNRSGPNCFNDQYMPYYILGIYKWEWANPANRATSPEAKRLQYFDESRIGSAAATFDQMNPAQGTAKLSDSTVANPVLSSLIAGTYVYELVVTDAAGLSDSDQVQITVNTAANNAPSSNAGANQSITLPTNTVSLSGSASTDLDGTITGYLWTRQSGPSAGSFSASTSVNTNFTATVPGTYVINLRVTDDDGATSNSTVTITINAAANILPTADAGVDQTITLPTNSIQLDGSGTDEDGTITGYSWSYVSGPFYNITNQSIAAPFVNQLVAGTYVFRLTVTDNQGGTDTDDMTITVNPGANQAPVADAGTDITIYLPNKTAQLDGSFSYDPDGNITSYLWSKVSGPTYTIDGAAQVKPTITNLVKGVYVFRLTVTDDDDSETTADVTVTVTDALPPNIWRVNGRAKIVPAQ